MHKIILSSVMSIALLSSSFANAGFTHSEGYGVGVLAAYSYVCENMTEQGYSLVGLFMSLNDVTADNLRSQPGVKEGYQRMENLGCNESKELLISSGQYNIYF